MRAPLDLRPRAGVEAQAERPHARPHPEKKNMVLYLCFWTLGLLLLLGLPLTSSIQTRRIAALTIRRAGAAGRAAGSYGIRKLPLHGRCQRRLLAPDVLRGEAGVRPNLSGLLHWWLLRICELGVEGVSLPLRFGWPDEVEIE